MFCKCTGEVKKIYVFFYFCIVWVMYLPLFNSSIINDLYFFKKYPKIYCILTCPLFALLIEKKCWYWVCFIAISPYFSKFNGVDVGHTPFQISPKVCTFSGKWGRKFVSFFYRFLTLPSISKIGLGNLPFFVWNWKSSYKNWFTRKTIFNNKWHNN